MPTTTAVGVAVGVAVTVGVTVEVGVGVEVGVAPGGVAVAVGAIPVGVEVGVAPVEVAVGVGEEPTAPRASFATKTLEPPILAALLMPWNAPAVWGKSGE